jgi:hypothetical protein
MHNVLWVPCPQFKRLFNEGTDLCNQIEDEHHFLFVCNKNLDMRNKYLPLIFQDMSNIGEGEKIKILSIVLNLLRKIF